MRSQDERVSIMATKEMLDRGWGKPAQTINAKVEAADLVAAHLQVLEELSGPRPALIGATAGALIQADDDEPGPVN